MGEVILITLLVLFLWFMDKVSRSPDMPKTDPKSQIKQLRKDLYSEINRLSQRVAFLESKLLGGNIVEQIVPEANLDIEKTNDKEVYDEYIIDDASQEGTPEVIQEEKEEIKQDSVFESILEEKQEEPKPSEVVIDKKKNKIEFESYLAADLFNKIGAVALILGVGFFLKYAYDNNLFAPIIQILLSALFGGGLIFGSVHFYKQEKYKIFAQGISGAGIAILYLTVYSGYSNYHLFNYPVSCFFMLLTTLIAFFQSVKYDSLATAMLALIGGFVTPFILAGDNSNSLGLLTYMVFLNSLVVALLYKKSAWKIMGIISIIATYLTYFSLHFNSYNAPNESSSMIFLTTIWLLYFVFDILKIKDSTYDYDPLNILNIILFYTSVYNLYYQYTDNIVIATFLISFAYLFSGISVYNQHKKLDIYLKQNFYIFAILLGIATNLAVSGFMKPVLFSAEGFLLVYFGTKYEKSYIQNFATIFFTISYLTLLCNPKTYSLASAQNFIPILNFRDLTFAIVIGLTVFGIKQLEKAKNIDEANAMISFYRFSWATLLFVFFGVEINDIMLKLSTYASSQETKDLILFNKSMSHVIVWSLYSTRLLFVGMARKIKPFTIIGCIGSTIAIYLLFSHGSAFSPIERFIPLFNMRTIAFGVTSACLIFIYNQTKIYKNENNVYGFIGNLASYTWCILLFYLIGIEITDTASKISMGNHRYLQLFAEGQTMIKTIGWTIYSVILAKIGTKKTIEPVIYFSIIGIAIAVINLVIYQYGYDQTNNFLPILNLRFLAFIITAAGLIITTSELKKNEDCYSWFKHIQSIFTYTWCTLLFALIGLEIATGIAIISNINNRFLQQFVSGQGMLQTIGWMIYSVKLLTIGFKKNTGEIVNFSLIGMGIAILYLFIQQTTFASSDNFFPVLNLRCLAFVTIIRGLIIANQQLKTNEEAFAWCKNLQKAFSYMYGIILFLLINFEINDYFREHHYIYSSSSTVKPLIISAGWLIYSILGIYFGIVKKVKPLRYLSLFVLGLTILKVFIFDLSFLDQLGRIISFMGLGTILLLLSFLYQKYSVQIKKLINEDISTKEK